MSLESRTKVKNHFHYENEDDIPYQHIKILGSGGFAIVDKVKHTPTGMLFARKSMKATGNQKANHKVFLQEIENLQKLEPNHHVVEFVSSYIHENNVSLLFSPVAQCDLEDLIQNHLQTTLTVDQNGIDSSIFNQSYDILFRSYGCLLNGLKFIHDKNIRHKDIKPRNILVQNGTVIYTDFGLSLVFLDNTAGSITYGRPEAMTNRYAPIEVIDWERRGRKADVWSLGCVFIEITAALAGKPTESLNEYLLASRADKDDVGPSYRVPHEALREWCSRLLNPLENMYERWYNEDKELNLAPIQLLELTLSMLHPAAADRKSVDELLLAGLQGAGMRGSGFCCKSCLRLFQEPRDTPFHRSAQNFILNHFVSEKPSVKRTELLRYAINWESPDAVRMIVEDDIRVDYVGASPVSPESSPIMIAIRENNADFVKLLLRRENHAQKEVSLFFAIYANSAGAVKVIIEDGVDVNCAGTMRDMSLGTPLIFAVESNRLDLVKILAQVDGIDLNKTSGGRSPLKHAIFHEHVEIAEFLVGLDGIDISKRDSQGISLLREATGRGQKEVARRLVEKGAKLFADEYMYSLTECVDRLQLWILGPEASKDSIRIFRSDIVEI
jgi:serine/threonine protein kinase